LMIDHGETTASRTLNGKAIDGCSKHLLPLSVIRHLMNNHGLLPSVYFLLALLS
jgi:hypothetical protein